MLFNSFIFIFLFLPLSCATFFFFAKRSRDAGAIALTILSLLFYSCWKLIFLKILIPSILVNFFFAETLVRLRHRPVLQLNWLRLGVALNLMLLFYFKYSAFFIANFSRLLGKNWHYEVYLPLGISFFTFTQIAYLVDLYRNEANLFKPVHYGLFVTYFPHLIAGPILHHNEMRPQFNSPFMYRFRNRNLMIGLTIFVIGLFKKVVLADSVAHFVEPVFSAQSPTFFTAWGGALSYTLQIYFDFSGYSDMAIGISKMFGIRLPINFNSPYRSLNIIQFWRRWHITLSRFLRDYLYIPLGGSRRGWFRRYLNLYLTMLLGGLWHGAGWTFVIWGGLHGLYLMVNHGWRRIKSNKLGSGPISAWMAHKFTFFVVVIAWIFFRANSFHQARYVLRGMFGRNGSGKIADLMQGSNELLWVVSLLFVVWCLPNTQQWMGRFSPGIIEDMGPTEEKRSLKHLDFFSFRLPTWGPNLLSLVVIILILGLSLFFMKTSPSKEFIYYTF